MVLNSDGTKKPFRKHKPSTERSAPDKPGLQARAAAAKILAAVVDRKLPLDGALDHEHGNPAYRALGESDRALVRAILNTTLRHLPRIDAAIAALLDSPLPEGARALHHVLAIGAAQILYLDVPDHSAVDLAVEQANLDPRNRRFAKLVNAILRRLGREKEQVLDAIGKVAPMPAWFIARLEKAYGRDAGAGDFGIPARTGRNRSDRQVRPGRLGEAAYRRRPAHGRRAARRLRRRHSFARRLR
ncbi:transcription termination factor NusB [Rhizobium leguminosarum]